MRNSMAEFLKILAVIVSIFSFFNGIYMGYITPDAYGGYSFTTSLFWWIIGFFITITLIVSSEIIRLLHEINKKL